MLSLQTLVRLCCATHERWFWLELLYHHLCKTMHCPVLFLTLARTVRIVMIIHSIVHLLVVLAWHIAAALLLKCKRCTQTRVHH